jgi:hypothetical protein
VCKSKAGTLKWEFDALKFHSGETVEDFGVRINSIANQLVVLGEGIEEEVIMQKFLLVVPPKFIQITMSIETLMDLEYVTVENLIGRLKAVEDRYNLDGGAGSSSGEHDLISQRKSWWHASHHGSSSAMRPAARTTRETPMRMTEAIGAREDKKGRVTVA